MTTQEATTILALMATFDGRRFGELEITAWRQILVDVDFHDARAAVLAWYGANRGWMQPADVRREIAAARPVPRSVPGFVEMSDQERQERARRIQAGGKTLRQQARERAR